MRVLVGQTARAIAAAATLVACGTEPGAGGPPPFAEIGTGIDAFEPLAEEIYLVEGPQGGRHVVGNVRMEGLDPGTVRADAPKTRFDVFKLDGTRVSSDLPPFSLAYIEDADGWFTLPFGRYVFIDLPAPEILDVEVEYHVQLIDRDGVMAEDVRRVTVKPYVE